MFVASGDQFSRSVEVSTVTTWLDWPVMSNPAWFDTTPKLINERDWYSYAPISTVPPTIRGLPSRSAAFPTEELFPALMQGELD